MCQWLVEGEGASDCLSYVFQETAKVMARPTPSQTPFWAPPCEFAASLLVPRCHLPSPVSLQGTSVCECLRQPAANVACLKGAGGGFHQGPRESEIFSGALGFQPKKKGPLFCQDHRTTGETILVEEPPFWEIPLDEQGWILAWFFPTSVLGTSPLSENVVFGKAFQWFHGSGQFLRPMALCFNRLPLSLPESICCFIMFQFTGSSLGPAV